MIALIGSPDPLTYAVATTLRAAGLQFVLCRMRDRERPEDDPTVRQPDITLARELLGWEPTVALEDGLARTIEWFRSHPELLGS